MATKQAVSEKKTFTNKMAAVVAILDFGSRGHHLCVSTQIAQGFGRRSQKLVFKMAAMAAIWMSSRHDYSYFSSTRQPVATL